MKTKKMILSLAAFVLSVAVHAQNWNSGFITGGANQQTATDVSGQRVVVGTYTRGTATFGTKTLNWVTGSSDPFNTTPNGFIVGYNTSNNVMWANRITSSAGVIISSVATTSSGQIYVCGTYSSVCSFYNASSPNATTPVATLQAAPGPGQITPRRGFIAKYSTSGLLIWARTGIGDSEVMTDVAVSEDNSQVVVSGRVFAPDGSTPVNTGSYVLWVDPANGNTVQAYNYSDYWNYTDIFKTGLCFDNSNNVIVSGRMTATSFAVQGSGGLTSVTSNGTNSTIYVKYTPSGAVSWARATRASITTPISTPSSLVADENNNIYIGGWAGAAASNYDLQFPTSATTNIAVPIPASVTNNGYIVKLNSSNGYASWRSFARNTTPGNEAISLAKSQCNFIYAAINTAASPTYTDAFGTVMSPAISSQGVAVFSLNTNGQLLTTTPWIINGLNSAARSQIGAYGNSLQCSSTAFNSVSLQTTGGSLTLTPTSGTNDVVLGTINYGGPAPTVTFPENIYACEGSTIVLDATVTGTPTFSYTWSVYDWATSAFVPIGTSTSPTFSVPYSVYSPYIFQFFNARIVTFQVTVTDCSGIAVSSNVGVILKQASIYSQVAGVDVCYKSQIAAPNAVFSVNTQNVDTYSWQYSADGGTSWSVCSGAGYSGVNTATLTVINPTAAMNNYLFRCKLGGCPSTMNTNAALLTVTPCPMRPGLNDQKSLANTASFEGPQLILYPNPANTTLEIAFEDGSDNENKTEAYVLDMTGRNVREIPFGNGHHTLDVSDLQNGTYSFVVLSNGKITEQQKFIVMH